MTISNDLEAARALFTKKPYAEGASGSADLGTSDATNIYYGTVVFCGDGETPYTYTAADGTEITVTLGPGEYAVQLDGGETVIVTCELPLQVGQRVALMKQGDTWVVISNEAINDNVQSEAQRLHDEGVQRAADAKAAREAIQKDIDDFKNDTNTTFTTVRKDVDTNTEWVRGFETTYLNDDQPDTKLVTNSELQVTKDGIESDVSDQLSKQSGEIESMQTRLKQTSSSITSLAKAERTYTAPDGTTASNGLYERIQSEVKQEADSMTITLKSDIQDAKNTANGAKSTADGAASDLSTFEKKFTFDSSGMSVKTTTGNTVRALTVDSSGMFTDSSIMELHTYGGVLGIKNWGVHYGSDSVNVEGHISAGSSYGGSNEGVYAYTPSGTKLDIQQGGTVTVNRTQIDIKSGDGTDWIGLRNGRVTLSSGSEFSISIADLAAKLNRIKTTGSAI